MISFNKFCAEDGATTVTGGVENKGKRFLYSIDRSLLPKEANDGYERDELAARKVRDEAIESGVDIAVAYSVYDRAEREARAKWLESAQSEINRNNMMVRVSDHISRQENQ